MTEMINSLVEGLAERMVLQGKRLVTAESCTGGGVAQACTEIAGSSQWFESGYVTYSNEAKIRDLLVPESIIEAHGAVSEEVVRHMVIGACRYGDLAIAVSGIAGPAGAVPDKPVGTVWIACGSEGEQLACKFHFQGDRSAVRTQSVCSALALLKKYLDK